MVSVTVPLCCRNGVLAMQTQLYGELKKILSSEKIVYVFGSGISSALADAPLNWRRWLNEGINYILDKNLVGELNKLIENNPTVDDLIYIAGEVITGTKKITLMIPG